MPPKIKKDEKAKAKTKEDLAAAKLEKEQRYLQQVRLNQWDQNELFVEDLKPHVSDPGYCSLPMNGLFQLLGTKQWQTDDTKTATVTSSQVFKCISVNYHKEMEVMRIGPVPQEY